MGLAAGGIGTGALFLSDGWYVTGIIVIVIGLTGLATWVAGEVRIFRARHEHWKRWPSRTRQSNEQFLGACGILHNTTDAVFALHVRRVLAELLGVPAETIHGDDSWSDPIWDSIDLLDISFRVEKCSGATLTPNWFDIAHRASGDLANIRVRHLIRGMIEGITPAHRIGALTAPGAPDTGPAAGLPPTIASGARLPAFAFTVGDTFRIKGRGVVVVTAVREVRYPVWQGDWIEFRKAGEVPLRAEVLGFDHMHVRPPPTSAPALGVLVKTDVEPPLLAAREAWLIPASEGTKT
jgi:acyl carrier protein